MEENDSLALGVVFGAAVAVIAIGVGGYLMVSPVLDKAAHSKNCDLYRVSDEGSAQEFKIHSSPAFKNRPDKETFSMKMPGSDRLCVFKKW